MGGGFYFTRISQIPAIVVFSEAKKLLSVEISVNL